MPLGRSHCSLCCGFFFGGGGVALWPMVVVGSDMGWICNGVVVGFNRVVVRYRFFGFGFCCCGFG